MREYVVVKAFTDKYTSEKYEVGKRLILEDLRAKEMNFNKTRILQILEDEYSEFILKDTSISKEDTEDLEQDMGDSEEDTSYSEQEKNKKKKRR